MLAGKGRRASTGARSHGAPRRRPRRAPPRVSAIVRDLRALSRSDDETRGPVDVLAVLASSIKMAHNEIRHRANVVQTFEADLPPVRANASRLGQVFLNLLINAAHAIPDGRADANEIRVRAHAQRRSPARRRRDRGHRRRASRSSVIGRIFDPFFTTKPIGVGHRARPRDLPSDRQLDGRRDLHRAARRDRARRSACTLPVAAAAAPQVAAPSRTAAAVPALAGADDRRRGGRRSRVAVLARARSRGRGGHARKRCARPDRDGRAVRRDLLRSDDAGDERHRVSRAARDLRAAVPRTHRVHDGWRVHGAGAASSSRRSAGPRSRSRSRKRRCAA